MEPATHTAGQATWTVTAPRVGPDHLEPAREAGGDCDFQEGPKAQRRTASWFVGRPVPPPPPVDPGTHYVSDLPFVSSTNGYGPVERDMSNGGQAANDGAVITVGGTEYRKGLGAHAPSDVQLDLDKCTRLTAVVGVDAEDSAGRVAFQVEGDGVVLWRSSELTGTATQAADVDVTGVSRLRLVVDQLATNGHDHSDWADAKVVGCAS